MSRRHMCEIACQLVHETDAAWCINDGKNEVWIPKSISEWSPSSNKVDGTMEVPEWFAEREGLI